MPAFEAVGRRIDPSQWTQLQFGLFSVPTGLSKAVVCTVLSNVLSASLNKTFPSCLPYLAKAEGASGILIKVGVFKLTLHIFQGAVYHRGVNVII